MSFFARNVLILLLTVLLTASLPAARAGAEPPPPAAAALPDRAQIEQAIKLLEDAEARDRLVRQLKALSAAAQAAEEEERVTVGARLLTEIRARYAAAYKTWVAAVEAVDSRHAVVAWLARQADNPAAKERWTYFFFALAVVLIAGYAARAAVWRMSARPRRYVEDRAPATTLAKLPFLVLRTLLNALPAVALAVAGYGALALTDPAEKVRLAALPIINAGVGIQLLLLAVAFFLSPTAPGLRLLPVDDRAATRAARHVRHIAAVGFYGWFLTESAFVLGLPPAAYVFILKLVGALTAGMIVYRLFSWRRAVARLIRGEDENGAGRLDAARRRLAEVWHLIAAAYVLVVCAVWLLDIKDGFIFLARATAVSALTLLSAQATVSALHRALARPPRLSSALAARLPSLDRRLETYRPWVERFTTATVWLIAAAVIFDAWGINVADRLASPFGQRVLGSVVTIALALIAAVLAWETVSLSIERALVGEGPDGIRIQRSARVRTLLPLLRNAFLVLLVVFVGLFSLAELGVNIAPLLAGAGVIGLAVGFGSQTLVKDVINGLFILIEDTIAVGDVVDVGGGHSGTVEAISIRTIRLRDISGAVHTVPFSSVATIRNLTKDFSYAVFDVQVGYDEDTDRVTEVLQEVAEDLQQDPMHGPDILAPLEVMGLERLADSGVVIRARFKTRPIRQWAVAREFNRRMKKRFDALGIGIPYPHMQVVWQAPPAPPAAPAPVPPAPRGAETETPTYTTPPND